MKFFFKIKTPKRTASSHVQLEQSSTTEYTNPMRAWIIGLCVATVVFVLGITVIAFDFYAQFGAPVRPATVESVSSEYQKDEVLFYVEKYSEKERVFNKLREDKPLEESLPIEKEEEENTEVKLIDGELLADE